MLSRSLAALRAARPPVLVSHRTFSAFAPSQDTPKRSRSNVEIVNLANTELVEKLRKFKDEETRGEDRKRDRVRLFSNAIVSISKHPDPIRTPADLANVARLWAATKPMIVSLLAAKRDHRGASVSEEELRQQVQRAQDQLLAYKNYEERFALIPGLGPSKVAQLVKAGCTTVEQLCSEPKYLQMLTTTSRVGVKWLEHFSQPVTRDHIETITTFFRDSLLSPWEVMPAGEYRRSAQEEMRETVLLLVHPSQVRVPIPDLPLRRRKRTNQAISRQAGMSRAAIGGGDEKLLESYIVEPMQSRGLIADQYSVGPFNWLGIVRVPNMTDANRWETRSARVQAVANRDGVFRWLRLRLASAKNRGAALIFATGDSGFIKYLNKAAEQQGLLLNEFGLWRFHPSLDESVEVDSPDAPMKGHWELLPSETEEQIMEELGVGYVVPEKRNFSNLKG